MTVEKQSGPMALRNHAGAFTGKCATTSRVYSRPASFQGVAVMLSLSLKLLWNSK